jgi:hypothetical protein
VEGLSRSANIQIGILEASAHLHKLHDAPVQLGDHTVGETLNAWASKGINAV